jgi:hypothetical protein
VAVESVLFVVIQMSPVVPWRPVEDDLKGGPGTEAIYGYIRLVTDRKEKRG